MKNTDLSLQESYSELFSSKSIDSIWIHYTHSAFEPITWEWGGAIKYAKDDLKGEKDFKGPTIEDVLKQMKEFVEQNGL